MYVRVLYVAEGASVGTSQVIVRESESYVPPPEMEPTFTIRPAGTTSVTTTSFAVETFVVLVPTALRNRTV